MFLYVPWAFKRLADLMVRGEPNLTPLLHSTITDVVRDGSSIVAVVIRSKRGPLAVRAKVFIDCSGDADLAFHAGVRVEDGEPRQHASMQFVMQHVDVAAAYGADLEKLHELLRTIGQDPGGTSRARAEPCSRRRAAGECTAR